MTIRVNLHPLPPRSAGRRGFTLVEILTAVAILAILISLTIIGLRHIAGGAKQRSTEVALKTLKSMMTEYQVNGNDPFFFDSGYTSAQVAAPAGSLQPGTPGYTSPAVTMTRQVLARLRAVTSIKKMLDDLPRDYIGEETSDGPIVLDAEKNPIIFVPTSGLTGVNLIKKPDGSWQYPASIIAEGGREKVKNTTNVPNPHPFWASAGPDGDLSIGDDNSYSFQK